jgi:hypothetical protein
VSQLLRCLVKIKKAKAISDPNGTYFKSKGGMAHQRGVDNLFWWAMPTLRTEGFSDAVACFIVGRVSVFCVTRQALRSNTMRLLMCAYGTLGGLRRKQRASPTLHRIKLRLSKCHSDMTPIYRAELLNRRGNNYPDSGARLPQGIN